jgi:hypothetical protein
MTNGSRESLDKCPALQQTLDYYYDQYEDDKKGKTKWRTEYLIARGSCFKTGFTLPICQYSGYDL